MKSDPNHREKKMEQAILRALQELERSQKANAWQLRPTDRPNATLLVQVLSEALSAPA